jgi:hypothetical protein
VKTLPAKSLVGPNIDIYLKHKDNLETHGKHFWGGTWKWKTKKELIIVLGKFVTEIWNQKITSFFDQFNIQEMILDKHNGKGPPATYAPNSQNCVVDGIWGLELIEPKQAGYLPFDVYPGKTIDQH